MVESDLHYFQKPKFLLVNLLCILAKESSLVNPVMLIPYCYRFAHLKTEPIGTTIGRTPAFVIDKEICKCRESRICNSAVDCK